MFYLLALKYAFIYFGVQTIKLIIFYINTFVQIDPNLYIT